jgi:hypothetical protein
MSFKHRIELNQSVYSLLRNTGFLRYYFRLRSVVEGLYIWIRLSGLLDTRNRIDPDGSSVLFGTVASECGFTPVSAIHLPQKWPNQSPLPLSNLSSDCNVLYHAFWWGEPHDD